MQADSLRSMGHAATSSDAAELMLTVQPLRNSKASHPFPSKLAEHVLLLLLTNAAGRCDERLHGASGIDGRAAASIGGVAARRGCTGPGQSFITLSR